MSAAAQAQAIDRRTKFTILVAALGYFVDVFDLILFSLLRTQSLTDLGIPAEHIKDVGAFILNWQMGGFIVGGILWGILGDKRGRLTTLIGSILIYSLANIANAFVPANHPHTVEIYAALRFIAGIGLAGEIGAGVALASELLPQRLRGWGTTLIAVVGLLGAIFAAIVADDLGWRTAYAIGGGMGLALLILRISVVESGMFEKLKDKEVSRGSLWTLLTTPGLLGKLLLVTLVGTPIWYVIGLIITFTPELARAKGMTELPTVAGGVMWVYVGLGFGGVFIGTLSQWFKSRKRAIFVSMLILIAAMVLYALFARSSVAIYYTLCAALGFGAGYWAMFLQLAAEQFGTNYRSTAASSAPNLVRGTTIPMVILWKHLSLIMPVTLAAYWVGAIALAIGAVALFFLQETFHRDLDFVEPV